MFEKVHGVTPNGIVVQSSAATPCAVAERDGRCRGYSPMESMTHFLEKLVFAAPASFLSTAAASQAVVESVSHFFLKLVSAAPASFFVVASALQLGLLGAVGAVLVAVWALALVTAKQASTATLLSSSVLL